MIAATLWAVDAIFRTQLTYTIPPISIVMIEHAIGFVILSPLLLKYWKDIRQLKLKDWAIIWVLTIVSSVLGGYFFTEALSRSFAQFDFVTPILLQKFQPIFVVLLSALILKEPLSKRFILLAGLALIGSYLMSFGTQPVDLQFNGKELIYLLALGAAASWGSGTIMSKYALTRLPFAGLTLLRFMLAVPVAFVCSLILGQTYNPLMISGIDTLRLLLIAGITGGALAIYLYYKGLQNTPARVSTFAELMLPATSILIALTPLNPYGEPQVLTLANSIGIGILITSVLLISFLPRTKHTQ